MMKIAAAALAVAIGLTLGTAAKADGRAVGVGMLERGTDYHNRFGPDPHRLMLDAAFPKMGKCPTEDSRECAWDAVHDGNGTGDSFWAPPPGVARVFYSHAPIHRVRFGDWAHVPDRQIGNHVDLINGGSRLVGEKTIWSVGPTSYWAWPGQDRIDYQLGTS